MHTIVLKVGWNSVLSEGTGTDFQPQTQTVTASPKLSSTKTSTRHPKHGSYRGPSHNGRLIYQWASNGFWARHKDINLVMVYNRVSDLKKSCRELKVLQDGIKIFYTFYFMFIEKKYYPTIHQRKFATILLVCSIRWKYLGPLSFSHSLIRFLDMGILWNFRRILVILHVHFTVYFAYYHYAGFSYFVKHWHY